MTRGESASRVSAKGANSLHASTASSMSTVSVLMTTGPSMLRALGGAWSAMANERPSMSITTTVGLSVTGSVNPCEDSSALVVIDGQYQVLREIRTWLWGSTTTFEPPQPMGSLGRLMLFR